MFGKAIKSSAKCLIPINEVPDRSSFCTKALHDVGETEHDRNHVDYWLNYVDGAPSRTLDACETLFRRDDKVEWAFLINEGRLFLQRALQDGELLTLHTANTSDLVAEASLFADRYHCDAITDIATTVSMILRFRTH